MTVRNQYQLPLCIQVASVVEISWLLIQLPTDPIVRVWPIAESLAAKICWKVSRRLGYHGIDFYINLKARESVQDLFRFVVMWIRFRLNLQISSRVLLLCFLLRCLSMSFPRANELLKAQRDIYCTCTQHKRAFIPGCIEVAFHHDLDWCLNHMLNFWNLMDEKVCICFKTWNWYGSLAHLHVHPVGTAIRSSTACHLLHFSPQAQDFVDVANCLFDLWDTNGWAQWYISISRNSVCIMICSVCSFAYFRACLHIILTIPKIKRHGWAARQGY